MTKQTTKFPISCNILLVGKTGAGKSSFANYLFGTEIFTTGYGEPVTNWEQNFQYYDFTHKGININVYDSVGLEANNKCKWFEEFDAFLSERQNTSSNNMFFFITNFVNNFHQDMSPDDITNVVKKLHQDKSPNEIIHSFFYVQTAEVDAENQKEIIFI
ncbi:MAG: 50S ribosome-binding GTPase [Treponemataceae bacterium]